MTQSEISPHLDAVAQDLLRKCPGAQHVVLLTTDGMPTAEAGELPRDEVDKAAAISSGALSSARAAAVVMSQHDDVQVTQVAVQTDRGWLLICGAGLNMALAVWLTAAADIGVAAHQMQGSVSRIATLLSAPARQDAG